MKAFNQKQYQPREMWLARSMSMMAPLFKRHGFTIPAAVRVSCGLPSVKAFGTKSRRIGEAWHSANSKDKHFEIFISPTIDDAIEVLATLAHEVVHVTVGLEAGHKGAFVRCAKAIGLTGKMTATSAGPELAKALAVISKKLGKYPHATLNGMTSGRKKQTTRMIKAECDCCGYKVRASISTFLRGVPKCPDTDCNNFDQTMSVELPEGE